MPFALVATECTDELLGVRYMAAVVCSLTCYPDVMVKVKVNFVMILTFLCQDSVSCRMCCETQPKEKATSRECTTSTKGLTETQVGCGHSCTSCSIQNSERAVITQE